jgi:hypothetical protein
MTEISKFPEASYLRIYHASRDLAADERARVEKALASFMGQWVAHEAPVAGAFEIVHDRFVVVAADESKTVLSGCSKDAMNGAMREIGAHLGLDFVHAPPICYREGDVIHSVTRADFADLVEQGKVTGATPVFDLTINTVGPYKAGRFELPAAECWHAKVYDSLGV